MMAQHRVGAELPEHQVGLLGDDGAVEALKHVADLLAADAAVEHGDRLRGEGMPQFGFEPARIIRRLRAGACACGRRRPDGDDGDRFMARQLARDMREWFGETQQIEWRIARRLRFRAPGNDRRGQHAGDGKPRGRPTRDHPVLQVDAPALMFPCASYPKTGSYPKPVTVPFQTRDRLFGITR